MVKGNEAVSIKGRQIRYLGGLIREKARLEYEQKFASAGSGRKDIERFLDENEEDIQNIRKVIQMDDEVLDMAFGISESNLRLLEYSNLLEEITFKCRTCDSCLYMHQYPDGMRMSPDEKDAIYCSLHPHFNPLTERDVRKIKECRQSGYQPYSHRKSNADSAKARIIYLNECIAGIQLANK